MNPAVRLTKKEIVTEFRTREILAAARRLVQRQGADAVTMEAIAAASGVAKGTVYLYFPGKEALIEALISQVGENMLAGIEAIAAGPGVPAAKIEQVASLLLDYLMRERALFPAYARDILRRGRGASPAYWKRLQEMEDKFVSLMTRVFAQGIEAGQFIEADPRLLTFLLRGMVRAVGYYQMEEGQTKAVEEALPVLLHLLSSGLTRSPLSSAEGAAR